MNHYADFDDLDYLTNHLAGLYIRMGKYQAYHQWLDKEQELLNQEKLEQEECINYQIYIARERAEVFLHQKNYSESKSLCNAVIKQANIVDNQRTKNYAKHILANIAIAEANFSLAEQLLKEGYEEVESNKDKRRMAYYEASFANLEKARGNLALAKQWKNQAQSRFNYLGMEPVS
ncbi:hypothetical protein AFK68_05060 [Hydrocoleum sp. CS-953]|nr:hypothetical protein AFK68_05060 [Hydrocoleum sp. CS-953]